jgi:hypothetical protein
VEGRTRLAGVAAAALLLVGCTPAGEGEAAAAATQFQRAISQADWAGACGLLSERTRTGLESAAARPCAQALPALRLPATEVGNVVLWGHNAEAMVGRQAVFLSRFTAGWRVIAAGCTSRGEGLPYECSVGS